MKPFGDPRPQRGPTFYMRVYNLHIKANMSYVAIGKLLGLTPERACDYASRGKKIYEGTYDTDHHRHSSREFSNSNNNVGL